MSIGREAIFAALFARLQTIAGVQTFSRIWTGWDTLEAIEQPAIVLIKGGETALQVRPFPPRWQLEAQVILLARVTEADPSVAPSTTINTLLDAVFSKLARQPDEPPAADPLFAPNPDMMAWTSLGGLCSSVRVGSDIVTDEGALGLQSVAVVPLIITTAG